MFAVGRDRRLVAILGQGVFQIDELALQLTVGGECFVVGIHQHVPFPAVDDDRVAVADVVQDARHAGDRRNRAAAGENCGMAGSAAGLGDDARHFALAERDHVRRHELVGHENDRPGHCVGIGLKHLRQVAAETDDHVADVGQPLSEVFVLGATEQLGVLGQQSLQGCLGRLSRVDDPGSNLGRECRILQDRFVDVKDGGLFMADLRFDLGCQRP